MPLADITFIRHDTPEAVVEKFFTPICEEFGPFDPTEVGIETDDGQQVNASEMIAGLREQHAWGFSDHRTQTVDWWADEQADLPTVVHMLAHEIGHITEPCDNPGESEAIAERYGRVARLALEKALSSQRKGASK